MTAGLAVFSVLLLVQARGVLSYLAASPSSVDKTSVLIWFSYAAWPLTAASALWLISLGLGRRAARALGIAPAGLPGAAASAALGLGLLAQSVFLLAWLGALNTAALAVVTAAAAALAYPVSIRSFAIPRRKLTPVEGACAGLLAYAGLCAVVAAIAPAVNWDVRAYHLALPELYLMAGRLVDVPWMIHSHWPRLMEVFYALPLAAGAGGAAALVHAGAAALLVAATASLAPAAWTAALLLAGQPALLRLAGTAHADAATALFVFAAAWALGRWEEEKRDGWLLFAGLLAGLSGAAKLLGVAALAAWTARLLWKTRRPREAALFAGAGLLMIGPWLWTTWLATGDPVWPFLRTNAEAAALAARNLRSNRWDFPPSAAFLAHDGPGFLVLPALGLLALSRGRRAVARRTLAVVDRAVLRRTGLAAERGVAVFHADLARARFGGRARRRGRLRRGTRTPARRGGPLPSRGFADRTVVTE